MTDPTPDRPIVERAIRDRLARGARAAHDLSEALWESLHEELSDPRPERVGELSEGLVSISSTVALLARAPGPPSQLPLPGSELHPAEGQAQPSQAPEGRGSEESSYMRDLGGPARAGGADEPRADEPRTAERRTVAVLVDELAPREPPREGSSPEGPATPEGSVSIHGSPSSEAPTRGPSTVREPARIEIRDERNESSSGEEPRREQGPDPWIASIGRRLERYGRDHLPFAVLLLELVGVERLRHAELPGEMARLTGLVEGALAAELRPADSLMRESPGRYWLLAPETDTAAAKGLAIRLAEGVRRAASHRGAPMELAAGIAVCPQDGRQTAALVARADIALYAAQASGRSVGPADEQG